MPPMTERDRFFGHYEIQSLDTTTLVGGTDFPTD